MKTYLLAGVMLCAGAGLAPALAQTAPPAPPAGREHMMMQPMTRAAIVEKIQRHFAKLDTNGDGFLDGDEAQAPRAERHAGPNGGSGAHRAHGGMMGRMLEMADANKDGRVSLQEATTAAAAHFDRVDANHDGTLSPDEMRAAHQLMRSRTGR